MRFGCLFLVACLVACSSGSGVTHVTAAAPPPKVAPATVEAFRPGVTTVEQVLQALGPPASDIVTADGNRKLAYSEDPSTPRWFAYLPILSAVSSDSPPNVVIFRFHRDGTLADITPPPKTS